MQRYLISTVLLLLSAVLSSLSVLPVSFLPGALFGIALGLSAYRGLNNGLPQVLALGAMGYILLLGCYFLSQFIAQQSWQHLDNGTYLLVTMIPAGLGAMLMYRSMAWQINGRATGWGLIVVGIVGYGVSFAETLDAKFLEVLPAIFNNHPAANLIWQPVVGTTVLILYHHTLKKS